MHAQLLLPGTFRVECLPCSPLPGSPAAAIDDALDTGHLIAISPAAKTDAGHLSSPFHALCHPPSRVPAGMLQVQPQSPPNQDTSVSAARRSSPVRACTVGQGPEALDLAFGHQQCWDMTSLCSNPASDSSPLLSWQQTLPYGPTNEAPPGSICAFVKSCGITRSGPIANLLLISIR